VRNPRYGFSGDPETLLGPCVRRLPSLNAFPSRAAKAAPALRGSRRQWKRTYLIRHGLDSISGYNGGADTIRVPVELSASDIKIYD
jgi:hypothetical protein